MMDMDMGPSATPTMSMSPSSTGNASMSGMDMDMGTSTCKMNMLWNWYTIDACFIAESWQISSRAQFGGTCVGVMLMVVLLEFVRRAQREYDRYVITKWREATKDGHQVNVKDGWFAKWNRPRLQQDFYQPSMVEQLVRTAFYVVQLGGAYIIMLLVMYYNGYIFFSILIGALIGYFVFGSDTVQNRTCEQDSCC